LLSLKSFRILPVHTSQETHWGNSRCLLEREREEKVGWGETLKCWREVIETKLAVLKAPRQCPLVLLVEVRLVCGICSILIFEEVGTVAMGRNVA
jgi:hypothetical protein